MPDKIKIDEYQGVGGCYVIDPDTGERRPANPPYPPLIKGGERSGGGFDLADASDAAAAADAAGAPAGANATDSTDKSTKPGRR